MSLTKLLGRSSQRFLSWISLIGFVGSLLLVKPIIAQRSPWTAPIQLNEENGALPDIVIDTQGAVHVFWGSVSDELGAIFHTRLTQQGWSLPRDILVSPETSAATWPRAVVSADGWIHLVWLGDVVYYSAVPEQQADGVRAWTPPKILSTGQATSPNIALDNAGRLHVVYVDIYHSPYVRHTLSEDDGMTWSHPVVISVPAEGSIAINAQLAIDSNDVLHVVWSETIEDFPPSGVYYSRSSDLGQTWSQPYPVAIGGYSWGSVGVDATGNIHLFWTGTGEWSGKYHSWSNDGGQTWTPIEIVWPGSAGFLGFADLFADTEGIFHVISSASDPQADRLSSGEVLHAIWQKRDWIDTENVSSGNWLRRRENQMPRVAVGVDSSIHVVWQMQNPNEAADPLSLIWYTTTSERQESVVLSSDSFSQSLLATPVVPVIAQPDVSTPSSGVVQLLPPDLSPQQNRIGMSALVLPVVSAGALVTIVVLVAQKRRTE